MVVGETAPGEDHSPAAQASAGPDFSELRGFQLASSAPTREGDGVEARREALRFELDARVARLHEAVDSSLALANDGAIRWLGDPIAKLARGPSLFEPVALILADEALTEEGQEKVRARVALWLAAHVKRLLGPLTALESLQEGVDSVRAVARQVAESLGVLERDRVRPLVKGLDQEARATLRKLGVRFGAYYIYLPALLKPAARALALQLHAFQSAAPDADAAAAVLAPLAASGRTSLAAEPSISAESYRVAGFRLCGDRAVRVDIVERLADIIRVALVEPASAIGVDGRPRRAASGFLITGQMTSMAGCSGEHFASILRGLGFACVQMKRSEFRAARGPAEPAGGSEAAPPASAAAPEGEDAPSSNAAGAVAEARPESDVRAEATPSLETEPSAKTLGVGEAEASTPVEAPARQTMSEAETAPAADQAAAESDHAAAAEAASAVEATDDLVEVWRPAPRPRPHHARPHGQHERRARQGKSQRHGQPAAAEDAPDPARAPPRHGRAEGEAGRPEAPADAEAPSGHRSGRKGDRGPRRDRPMDPKPKAGWKTASEPDHIESRPPRGPSPHAAPDPNSPFAKLLQLRAALESQSKKRP